MAVRRIRLSIPVQQKKLARNCSRASSLIITSSFQLSSCGNNDDGDGGDSKLGGHCASSTIGKDSTRSSHRGDTHSTSDNRNSSRPGIQSRLPQFLEFRRKSALQN